MSFLKPPITKIKAVALLGFLLFLLPGVVGAQVRLPKLISDGMVLQRDAKIKLWGWAAEKEKVIIQLNGKTYTTTTGTGGRWSVQLPAMKAGGPYSLTIKGSNTICSFVDASR